MQPAPVSRVAVIGAGLGGLACARALVRAGLEVVVFDKSRGVGGRCSTRRAVAETGSLSFDHGAQYFTVRDPGFAAEVARWRELGRIATWTPRLWSLDGELGPRSGAHPVEDEVERLVAVPGMSSLGKLLLADIEAEAAPGQFQLHLQTRIASVTRDKFAWSLQTEGGETHEDFAKVVVNTPSGQAAPLLADATPELEAAAERCVMHPCWTLMLGLPAPLGLEFDAAFVRNSPLAWIAANHSKPGRPDAPCWVLQASETWSQTHFEVDVQFAVRELLAAFEALVERRIEPSFVSTQRWRYAKPEPLSETHLLAAVGIGACGDWCGGPRVEGAYLSGLALAQALQVRASTTV